MATKTKTYGTMPSREEFDAAYDAMEEWHHRPGFRFGNDARLGDATLTASELWDELQKAKAELDEGDEAAGDWCSAVLECLDIEWV